MAPLFRRLRAALQRRSAPRESKEDEGLRIRAMTHRDLGPVAAIEDASFTSPWRRTSYARTITEPTHHFYVAELAGRLVGYAGFWAERRRAHIAKVAVEPARRRRGIGSALLTHLLEQICRLGLAEAYLEVRKSNRAAQELYRRFHFRCERVQANAYPDNGEDALVLVRDDLLDAASPSRSPETEARWNKHSS